jgi:hypothetical protein
VIAVIVHIILSGELVLFGSLYRFGQSQHQSTGDLVYLQDKKVVTQKITEYTKITNLQNDIVTTIEELAPAMFYIVSWTVTSWNMSDILSTSPHRARALTNDGLLFVSDIASFLQGNRSVVSQEGSVYAMKHRYTIEGKSYWLIRLAMEEDEELLSKTVDIVSYTSPFSLGQWYVQVQSNPRHAQLALCSLIQVSQTLHSCQEFLGVMQQEALLSLYGQLIGVYEQGVISAITKEQFQQRLQYIEKNPSTDRIPQQYYASQFVAIDNFVREQYGLRQTQGWFLRGVDSRDGFASLKTGDVITKISWVSPVMGRDVSSLLQGIAAEDIVFQR